MQGTGGLDPAQLQGRVGAGPGQAQAKLRDVHGAQVQALLVTGQGRPKDR